MTADPSGNGGVVTKHSRASVPDTVARFTSLLESKDLTVFAVIDQAAEAEHVGLTLRPTTLVIFGSPRAGIPVMDAAPLAALDLPLKVLIWDDGGQTKISYVSPDIVADRNHLEPALAANLAGIDALTDALTK